MTLNKENFCQKLGLQHPIFCGPMFPCSNPELVAAASAAGILGVMQPLSMTYSHGWDFQDGMDYMKSVTPNPIGMNALIESSTQRHLDRMKKYVDLAIENGVRVIITSLGKPDWVVKKLEEVGGYVFHDVTQKKWAQIGADCGVHGLICVNDRAGGHLGQKSKQTLFNELKDFKIPLICAGGISTREDYLEALEIGYCAVQLGTRFIASKECNAHIDYKRAIVKAKEKDITETLKISGVPISVINTEHVQASGTKLGKIESFLFKNPKTKKLMRALYALKMFRGLSKANSKASQYKGYWCAGRSVEGIDEILSVQEIVDSLVKA